MKLRKKHPPRVEGTPAPVGLLLRILSGIGLCPLRFKDRRSELHGLGRRLRGCAVPVLLQRAAERIGVGLEDGLPLAVFEPQRDRDLRAIAQSHLHLDMISAHRANVLGKIDRLLRDPHRG